MMIANQIRIILSVHAADFIAGREDPHEDQPFEFRIIPRYQSNRTLPSTSATIYSGHMGLVLKEA